VIVSPRDGRLVLVRQVDHQEQCALMADAWGGGDFARPEPFAPIRAAAAVHDEGWREWEDAPRVRDGAPVDFPDIDRPTHVDLYRRGIRHAESLGPRVGLLVSLHGRGLYEGRGGLDPGPPTPREEREPAVRAFLAEQDGVVERLRARLGAGAEPGWEWAAYRLLQTWDALSLYLTWRALPAGRDGTLPRVPRSAGDHAGVDLRLRALGPDRCSCEPWPFAAARVELPVRARAVPARAYADAGDLAAAPAGAPWIRLVSVVTPA
jgi:hypothetical protein